MKNDNSLLSRIEIAKPCRANWEEMTGDERVRACQLCHLNVYNISTMTQNEAESFLRERLPEGSVCVRLYRRHDGTIITDNCPRGLRAARDAAKRVAHRVAAAASLLLAFLGGPASQSQNNGSANNTTPEHRRMMGKIAPTRLMGEPTASHNSVMGDVAVPAPVTGTPVPLMGGVCPPKPNLQAYVQQVQTKISKVWKIPAGSNEIKVVFKINPNGSISDLKIARSSGDANLDKKALGTVRRAAPFDNLSALSATAIDADFTFR